jgi:septum formation protein
MSLPVRKQVVLASSSPRRQELLRKLGVSFHVRNIPVNEHAGESESVEAMVSRIARAKANAAGPPRPGEVIIAADTGVVFQGEFIGKPVDAEDARRTLERLRGHSHQVITALLVLDGEEAYLDMVTTTVQMRRYSDEEISAYVARGEPFDKAGSYAIQDRLFDPVDSVQGCPMNVLGLPLCYLCRRLRSAGVAVPVLPQSLCEGMFGGTCLARKDHGCPSWPTG